MTARSIRQWFLVHKWSSILCTLFLLMLCITGLPLIFHDEIEALLEDDVATTLHGPASASAGLPLDQMVARAQREGSGGVPLFMGFSDDGPVLTVTTGPSPDAPGEAMRLFSFNRATGETIGEVREEGVMHFLLEMHTDMFLGLPGMLFLGVMGALFVIAIISGVVLYVPFMRRLRFGTLRTGQSRRLSRLDHHNLLGIVTLGWALAIGLTGVINAFADPLTDNWRESEITRIAGAYRNAPPLDPARYASLDAAMAAAQQARPGLVPQFIAFPGGGWSTPYHYTIFFQGDTPLTRHFLTPALVDARTATLTDVRSMPALNQVLMLSKPLHFGNYGGLPLKLLWAVLDLATIWVLVSGLQLWLGKGRADTDRRVAEIAAGGMAGASR